MARTKNTRQQDGSGGQGATGAQGKPRHHISRACLPCKESHGRCDGTEPTCGNCAVRNRECQWPTTVDRRRRFNPEIVAQLNARIVQLEAELQRVSREKRAISRENEALRGVCVSNNFDIDKAVPPRGPSLTVTVPGGGFGHEAVSPGLSSAPSSPWSIGPPSPYTDNCPFPSPQPDTMHLGQYLSVPGVPGAHITAHGRSGSSSDEDVAHLPFPPGGHMYKNPASYGFGNGTMDPRMDGGASPYASSSSSLAPSPWLPPTLPALAPPELALTGSLAAMNIQGGATERQDQAAAAPYPDGGAGTLLADLAPQGYAQGMPMAQNYGFNYDASALLAGTYTDASHASLYDTTQKDQ